MTDHDRRILIVDENRSIHADLRGILSGPGPGAGYEIRSAHSDAEGAELVRAAVATNQPYAVALVDVRAPGDGLRAIGEMLERDPALQIVICTALSEAVGRQIAARFPTCDRLVIAGKPIDPIAVRQLVLALAAKWQLARNAGAHVAELARSRADLTASLALAGAVQDTIADSLLVVGPDRKVITASRRFIEMWNLSPAVIASGDASVFLRSVLDQLIEPEAVVARVDKLRGSPDETGNDELRCKDGRIVERWTAPVRSASGGNHGRLWLFRDITERRKLELDRAVGIERMTAMGRLAAGVGHEINNPLTYAIGNIESLLEASAARGTPPPASELIERLQEARDGLARIRVIVGDLQTLARADDSLGEVDLKQAIEQAIQIAGAELRHRAPIVRHYKTVPPIVGSRIRLGQVFLNLIVNAAQAIPDGQSAQNRIEVAIRDTGDTAIVEVTDTGSGIAPEHLERIFDPFFTTKEVGAGTGLGLAISRDIVAGHKGTLTVKSAVGVGTTMTVAFPHAPRPVRVTAPPAPAAAPARKARVLVIDDEPLISRILQRGLSRHQVVVAADAREALALIQRGEVFDVILCDLMMPDLSGIDVHEYLTREYPAVATRLVFMTGGAFTSKARQFLSSVTNERIDKPFSLAQVNKLVDRRLAASPG